MPSRDIRSCLLNPDGKAKSSTVFWGQMTDSRPLSNTVWKIWLRPAASPPPICLHLQPGFQQARGKEARKSKYETNKPCHHQIRAERLFQRKCSAWRCYSLSFQVWLKTRVPGVRLRSFFELPLLSNMAATSLAKVFLVQGRSGTTQLCTTNHLVQGYGE